MTAAESDASLISAADARAAPFDASRRGGEPVRWRAEKDDEFEVGGLAARVARYGASRPAPMRLHEPSEDDLTEKAATLIKLMPRNQHRETIELILSPNDPHRGRRAVDALIDAAVIAEDDRGRIRRVA